MHIEITSRLSLPNWCYFRVSVQPNKAVLAVALTLSATAVIIPLIQRMIGQRSSVLDKKDSVIEFADPSSYAFAKKYRAIQQQDWHGLRDTLKEVREVVEKRKQLMASASEGRAKVKPGLAASLVSEALKKKLIAASEGLTLYMIELDLLPVGHREDLKKTRKELILEATGWCKELDEFQQMIANEKEE